MIDEPVRRVVATPDDVIQDGVVLHISTDEAMRSIMNRCYPEWTAIGIEDGDGVIRTVFASPDD
jgi:hypothetical protein